MSSCGDRFVEPLTGETPLLHGLCSGTLNTGHGLVDISLQRIRSFLAAPSLRQCSRAQLWFRRLPSALQFPDSELRVADG